MIALAGIISSICIFWFRTQESWAKTKELERRLDEMEEKKASSVELRSIDDKVTRQYQVQRDMNTQTNDRVYKVEEWIHYHEGYEQARKDYKIKP